jgi:serine/threonine-protein kinase
LPAPDDKPAALGPYDAPRIGEAQRRFWLIIDAMLAAIVVVAIVGGWAYSQVRESLRELRAAGLASLLEAESRALELWIGEKKSDAERWASTPAVQRAGSALAQAAGRGDACAAPAQKILRDEIAPYTANEEVSAFNLIARDGSVLAALDPRNCGRRVSDSFLREVAPVFEGRGSVFVRPWPESDRLGPEASAARLSWIETPVRGEDGAIVAALGFGRDAEQRFAGLLTLSNPRTSRDVYAFDERGVLATRTRHGLKPGMDVRGTRLADMALSRSEGNDGMLLEPYRSYRGAQVIGAWHWLPDARIAVAVEIDASEAYGPLGFLPIAFGVLTALVLVSMTAAASTSLWAVRARVRESQRVGPYRIEREIGEGGMSRIYFARHETLKRPAAVKVLKPHLATDEAITRFRREAQLGSQLSHPNTVEIYDYGTTRDGRWYYAMEYLRGISIEALVRGGGPMPLSRALHALRQACGSLKEAHDRGWVHRDVKPGNLMLCERGGQHDVLKMVDFGLIKQVRDPHTHDITQYSRILGTPLYMAPERIRDPSDADARADIYALAAVAYFALVGRPAFDAETDHDIVYRVMNEPPPPLPEGIEPSGSLAALVARCLAKDRDARPESIDAVRAVLDRLAADHPWTEADARAWWEAHAAALGV